MSLRLLMDVHIDSVITEMLRAAGVDVLTAQEDGSAELADPELLDRALELGRELFTHDRGFHAEAARRQRMGVQFCCIFFAAHAPVMNRIYSEWLETHAKLENPEDVAGRVIYIP